MVVVKLPTRSVTASATGLIPLLAFPRAKSPASVKLGLNEEIASLALKALKGTIGGCAKTHAAPTNELSTGPPTTAVLPSADSATELPWREGATAPVPTSLLP